MTATATPSFSLLDRYLERAAGQPLDRGAVGFFAGLDQVASVSPSVAVSIAREVEAQRTHLKLIASENYSSLAVQLAHANLLTDKYAEGVPQHRFYAGCENVDAIETEAARLACELFGADHAYVQPHSGADANLVAFLAILSERAQKPLVEQLGYKNLVDIPREQWQEVRTAFCNQRLLALDFYSGGHLTHGYRFNISARLFDARSYTVDRATGLLDLDALRAQVQEVRPLILLAGYSAYPRKIDFARMREIADEVGATFMVDMAHFAGLVAGKVFTGAYDPVPHAHVVTSTTHKTLRGPRGGIVLSSVEYADAVDKGCPAVLGGPLPHVMAAKVIALQEAAQPTFAEYAARIVENAQTLAAALQKHGMTVATGGTDNHIVLADVAASFGLTGRQAESALRTVGMTLNRNSLPFDVNGPWYTSGLRLGTPALTTLGMGAAEVEEIAEVMTNVLRATTPVVSNGTPSKAKYTTEPQAEAEAKSRMAALCEQFPVYPEIDLSIIDPAA
jgi:glycine hydroxymethyltransferase